MHHVAEPRRRIGWFLAGEQIVDQLCRIQQEKKLSLRRDTPRQQPKATTRLARECGKAHGRSEAHLKMGGEKRYWARGFVGRRSATRSIELSLTIQKSSAN